MSGVAHAQLAQNLLIGNAKALSLGNAVTADPPGIDSIHFNPAGLSRLRGTQYELKFIAADVAVEGEFNSNPRYDCLFEPDTPECPKNTPPLTPIDPYRNTKSTVDKFAIYLPGKGITSRTFVSSEAPRVVWRYKSCSRPSQAMIASCFGSTIRTLFLKGMLPMSAMQIVVNASSRIMSERSSFIFGERHSPSGRALKLRFKFGTLSPVASHDLFS